MANDNSIYYRYDEQYDLQLKILKKESITERNKELILQFSAHLFSTGTKPNRVAKLIWGLRKICRTLENDLDKATKTDIERIVATIQTDKKYKDNTKSDYKRALKHFFKWFEDEDQRLQSKKEAERLEANKVYKYLRKYVKTTTKPAAIDPGNIIFEEEMNAVIKTGCRTDMERAFLKTMHETGFRIGELLGMKIKDIQRKEQLWNIRVDGKTGERLRPVLDSIPYISRWLDHHPGKNNQDAYVWVSTYGKYFGQRIRYFGARRIIERAFERAGIQKQNNPHWFRHSRSTLDAAKYTDAIQCEIMGWAQGSNQMRRYRHMSGKQSEDAFLSARGIKRSEDNNTQAQPIKCICGRLNEPEAKYCSSCAKALRLETAIMEKEYMDKAFQLIGKIMADPQLKAEFEKYRGAV